MTATVTLPSVRSELTRMGNPAAVVLFENTPNLSAVLNGQNLSWQIR
jgi:hypothetical protein